MERRLIEIGKLKRPILAHVQDFVALCAEDFKTIDPWNYKNYRYLTIQSSVVEKGTAQRAPYWHVDNPTEEMPVYMVVEGQPTEFKGGEAKPLTVYRCGTKDFHRSPKVTRTHRRTFMRLAYSKRAFQYNGDTADLNLMIL